jgi:hypothetical protein
VVVVCGGAGLRVEARRWAYKAMTEVSSEREHRSGLVCGVRARLGAGPLETGSIMPLLLTWGKGRRALFAIARAPKGVAMSLSPAPP